MLGPIQEGPETWAPRVAGTHLEAEIMILEDPTQIGRRRLRKRGHVMGEWVTANVNKLSSIIHLLSVECSPLGFVCKKVGLYNFDQGMIDFFIIIF